jgi:hypothetical protein
MLAGTKPLSMFVAPVDAEVECDRETAIGIRL